MFERTLMHKARTLCRELLTLSMALFNFKGMKKSNDLFGIWYYVDVDSI